MRASTYLKLVTVLLVPILVVGVCGCADKTVTSSKPAVYDLGVGLFGPSNNAADKTAPLRYDVPANGIFKANYVTDTQTGGKRLLVIALDNGKQTEFTLNGDSGLGHTIVALSGQHTFSMVFGPFDAGLHNIVVLAIADPDNHQLDSTFRTATATMTYPTKPLSLIVGGSSLAHLSAVAPPGESVPDSNYGDIALAPTDNMELKTWLTREAKAGEQIDCFVHLGNPSTVAIPYTLCVLLNGLQVPIMPDGAAVVSGGMKAGQRLILPIKLTAPDQPGTYELMSVVGINPFVMQPKTTGAKTTTFYIGSTRTALIVK